jgi:rhodanese-related sulfurtransferase
MRARKEDMHELEMHNWEMGPGMELPPCVLDLRTADQFQRGHIPGSTHLSYNQFQADALTLVAGCDWVLLVDAGGARAAEMAVWIRARGVNARYLVGGMSQWRGALETA